jgi:hypothetical protein
MLCHSVRSCHLSSRSLNLSLVARLKLATGMPVCEYLTSGSLPTFPMRMTLFTLFRLRAGGDCNLIQITMPLIMGASEMKPFST